MAQKVLINGTAYDLNNPYVFAATADCSIILADTGNYSESHGRITITMQ